MGSEPVCICIENLLCLPQQFHEIFHIFSLFVMEIEISMLL
jgi:hypothetical protein